MDSQAGRRVPLSRARPSRVVPFAALLCAATLAGCASSGGVGGVVGKAMESVGLKAPSPSIPKEHTVPLRLYAAANLNAGSGTRPLALVVRVYQLRNTQRFEQAAFAAFLDEKSEQAALGSDLVTANEVLLTPGQRHEVQETVAADARYIGVVALFRAPAASRWRFSFDSRKATVDGITVGLHACAMTTTSPALETQLASEPHALSSTNCAVGRR